MPQNKPLNMISVFYNIYRPIIVFALLLCSLAQINAMVEDEPVISIASSNNVLVSLEEGTFTIELKVWLSNDNEITGFYTTIDDGWITHFWDFNGLAKETWHTLQQEIVVDKTVANSSMTIKVPNVLEYGGGLGSFFIDDIAISNYPTHVDNNSDLICKVYPNPTKGLLTIEAPIDSRVQIVNLSGAVLKQFVMHSTLTNYNTNSFPKGMHFVQIQHANSVVVKKILFD